MATVFRRMRWVASRDLIDPATGKTFRKGQKCPRGIDGAKRVKSKNYTIAIKFPGGRVRTFNGSRWRSVAEQKAADYEKRKARGDVGLADPFDVHRRRPIKEHLDDWLKDLAGQGTSAKYRLTAEYRMTKLFKACGWGSLGDVSADSFAHWRDDQPLRADGKPVVGPVTQNQYFQTMRAFLNWAVKRKRWGINPLASVETLETRADIRRERRALTLDELAALAKVLPDHYTLIYRFLWTTGLRRNEVVQLQWRDVRLKALPRPFLQLRAATTKNNRDDTLPLRPDIAAELAESRHGAGDDEPVFPAVPSIARHKALLKKAGIPFEDEHGRRVDFHAMRHTFCTYLSQSGASPREAMELMRHSELGLTMKFYTDPSVFNLGSKVDNLPLPGAKAQAEDGKATG